MTKTTKELMSKYDTYIEPLDEAIELWNKAIKTEDKRDYIKTIGEIGNLIHQQNKMLNV